MIAYVTRPSTYSKFIENEIQNNIYVRNTNLVILIASFCISNTDYLRKIDKMYL